ncbi:MAG: phospholipase [Hyphomicrobiales bacterium]|nr:phospholipase [Hyphomicrobiales bacterium]
MKQVIDEVLPGGFGRIAREQDTCWRVAHASRAALLIDGKAHYAAAKAAMLNARRSILLLGWEFDPRTRLEPHKPDDGTDAIGAFLIDLAKRRPDLDVHLLIWDMAAPIAAAHDFFPQRARAWFRGKLRFELADGLVSGACHHQKVLVIDDELAFCGGGDFAMGRWDTHHHRDHEPSRRLPASGKHYPPRHDVMMMVEGAAARALGELARRRWLDATGQTLPEAPEPASAGEPSPCWPDHVSPDITDTSIAIARTRQAGKDRSAVRENERLHLAAISAARDYIYLENQYFASAAIGEALLSRLQEENGPEIIVVTSPASPGLIDRTVMDSSREALLARLHEADRYGRFHPFAAHTQGGDCVIVHSKVTIIDDRMLRVGSANLNNRSFGFDTECDMAIEAYDEEDHAEERRAILAFRDRLIGHFLDCEAQVFSSAVAQQGSLARAIHTIAGAGGRLRPFARKAPGAFSSFVARWHLGDPFGVEDAWRPWRRHAEKAKLDWATRKSGYEGSAGSGAVGWSSSSTTSGR